MGPSKTTAIGEGRTCGPLYPEANVTVILGWSKSLNAWLVLTPDATYFTRTIPAGALDKRRRYPALLLGGVK